MKMNKSSVVKKVLLIIITIVILAFFILLGLDKFAHGFYYNEIDVAQIAEKDRIGTVEITAEPQSYDFVPLNKHFTGFELYLTGNPEDNSGQLVLSILDPSSVQVDEVRIDFSKIEDSVWYKAYLNKELKQGVKYTLVIHSEDALVIPSMMLVDDSCLAGESSDNNLLIGYAYKQPTFSSREKVLIVLFVLGLYGVCIAFFVKSSKTKKLFRLVSVFLILTVCLSWTYMFNSMDNQNTGFDRFQEDSETLVASALYGDRDGISFLENDKQGFGLARYYDLKGYLNKYGLTYVTNDNWLEGYSRTSPSIAVNSNIITRKIAVAGNSILFKNGEEYTIKNVTRRESYLIIELDTDNVLSRLRNGSLDDTVFMNSDHEPLDKSMVVSYKSQYGLQGKIFKLIARHLNKDTMLVNLNFLCAVATAAVFVLITILLAFKYNYLLAGCFFFTFWLSPWVVNFARNLYWVEFTWFVPMAIGLFCAWKVESRKARIFCYVAAFIAIAVKCLCGYEYISSVMMGLVAFLVTDFICAVIRKDKAGRRLLLRTAIIMGIVALAGFMAAICLHASLKSGGNIIEGIKLIIKEDVLRRTSGADLNEYASRYWESINASVWEVFCKYFHFSTEVVTGIKGNLFPLLCITPLVIFIFEFRNKKINYELLIMYIFFFLTAESWFCLAKSHSYIHTHMNYVLWYFGFVQICFYILISKAVNFIQRGTVEIIKTGPGKTWKH